MLKSVKKPIKLALNNYIRWINRKEYNERKFVRFNERPVEFAFVFEKLGQLYPKTVLDVGTGKTALPHMMQNCGLLVSAIDNVTDYWPDDLVNRHYHVMDEDITNPTINEKFDAVTCISVLEHIDNFDAAVKNMLELLNPGGHLILTCPFTADDYCPNVYKEDDSTYGQSNPYITQSFSTTELDRWLSVNNAEIVEEEYWEYWTGKYWTVGEQVIPPRKTDRNSPHQLACFLIKKAS